jgi:hypothetical protein
LASQVSIDRREKFVTANCHFIGSVEVAGAVHDYVDDRIEHITHELADVHISVPILIFLEGGLPAEVTLMDLPTLSLKDLSTKPQRMPSRRALTRLLRSPV